MSWWKFTFFVALCLCLSACLYLYVCLSACLYLSGCLSVCLSSSSSSSSSSSLSVCMSVCLSLTPWAAYMPYCLNFSSGFCPEWIHFLVSLQQHCHHFHCPLYHCSTYLLYTMIYNHISSILFYSTPVLSLPPFPSVTLPYDYTIHVPYTSLFSVTTTTSSPFVLMISAFRYPSLASTIQQFFLPSKGWVCSSSSFFRSTARYWKSGSSGWIPDILDSNQGVERTERFGSRTREMPLLLSWGQRVVYATSNLNVR